MITKIQSNIKGGVDVAGLGPLTLIVGPSGSGKTSIWNSVELAFLGGCSDVGAVEWMRRDRSLLDELAPPDASHLWSKVTMADGSVCTADIERNKSTGGAKKIERTGNAAVSLPVAAFSRGMRGSSKAVRAFLLDTMTSTLTDDDVLQRINPDVHASYTQTADSTRSATDTPVTLLLSVLKVAGDRSRKAVKAAKASKAKANDAGAALDPEPSDAEMADLEAAVAASAAALSECQPRPKKPNLQALYERARARTLEFQHIKEAWDSAKAEHDAVLQSGKPMAIIDAAHTVVSAQLAVGLPSCMACRAPLGGPEGAIMRDLQTEYATISDQYRARTVAAQAHQAEYSRLVMMETKARVAIDGYEDALRTAEAIDAMPVHAGNRHELVGALTMAQTALSQSQATRHQWGNVRALQATAEDSAAEAAQWVSLADACTAAVASLLTTLKAAYVARVNELLPAGDVFDLVLRDTEGNDVCRFGLVTDSGHLRTALCGGELCRVLAAMTLATHADTPDGHTTVITLPKDIGLDRHTLRSVMVAFSALASKNVQVILTSVVTHAGQRPAGWTLVNLTADGVVKVSPPKGKTKSAAK